MSADLCHDVCHSHLLQFAGAKQAVLRVPTLMSVRCPCRASLAGAYHISVPLESSMQAAHFAAKLNVFARMHSNSLGCLVGKLYQANYSSVGIQATGHCRFGHLTANVCCRLVHLGRVLVRESTAAMGPQPRPLASSDLAISRQMYAADRSTLVGSLPEKAFLP